MAKVLDLGYNFSDPDKMPEQHPIDEVDGRRYPKLIPPRSNTLELPPELGMRRLDELRNLEVFGLEGIDHQIGTKELD